MIVGPSAQDNIVCDVKVATDCVSWPLVEPVEQRGGLQECREDGILSE